MVCCRHPEADSYCEDEEGKDYSIPICALRVMKCEVLSDKTFGCKAVNGRDEMCENVYGFVM
jgi:hypothetical protein